MNRATTFNRALSLGGTLSLILLVLLAIAFQTTGTREAEAQTTVTKMLVDGSPWKSDSASGVIRKVRLRFFLGKDGKFTATYNKRPTSDLNVDGKKVTLTGKKRNGNVVEFSLTLNNEGKLSGSAVTPGKKGGWKTLPISLISALFFFEPVASAEKANDPAFARLLVEKSPWSVTWNSSFYDGTFKISFADAGDGNFTGKLFDNSGGRSDGALKNIVIHDNRCVSFFSHTDTKYDSCLEENGTLTGTQFFTSNIGATFEGTTVFLPRGR